MEKSKIAELFKHLTPLLEEQTQPPSEGWYRWLCRHYYLWILKESMRQQRGTESVSPATQTAHSSNTSHSDDSGTAATERDLEAFHSTPTAHPDDDASDL
jgi:hypothetical protein